MRSSRVIFLGAALAAVAALAAPAHAATPCNATVHATAKSDQTLSDQTVKVWAVQADTTEPCAKVYVDLKVTERLFNGEEITSTHRGFRKVTGGISTTYKVDYKIARDTSLTDWSFKVVSCVVCGTE